MKKYYLVLLIVSVLFTGGCGINEDKISVFLKEWKEESGAKRIGI